MRLHPANGFQGPVARRGRKRTGARQIPVPMSTPDFMPYFSAMSNSLGPMKWWPARTRFEVIVGAILTQNTSWKNVELAIANLRAARMLTPSKIGAARTSRIQSLIRSAGYFRQKTRTLKAFVYLLDREYGGSLKKMLMTPTGKLRAMILEVRGIGPETADSILLYAGEHPVFVVDTYTHRILERHGIANGKRDYEETRAMFENSLPRDATLYNQFHALIVNTGKNWCRKAAPICEECPLRPLLPSPSLVSLDNMGPEAVAMDATI
jgi:endonuclease III related protein